MITTKEIMEHLTGKGIVQELVDYAECTFDDFKDVRDKYFQAIELFRGELAGEASPSVDDLVDAIERQTASYLLFSGVLGLQSNYAHFVDPMARTVLDVDSDVYLRENMARRLPAYEEAEQVIDTFYEHLTSEQKDIFGDVIAYSTYLETVGPKLAHFCGYILGEEILHRVVLGYYPDEVLTMQYRKMLSEYLGFSKTMLLDLSDGVFY